MKERQTEADQSYLKRRLIPNEIMEQEGFEVFMVTVKLLEVESKKRVAV